jgi:hypothetical protein
MIETMNANRQKWNQGQQNLRRALAGKDVQKAIALFLAQHAMVHSQEMSGEDHWSFEDEVLVELAEEQYRYIPAGGEHSIAWILFHIARIEDITMNMLVAGTAQLFTRDRWMRKLCVTISHSANRMGDAAVTVLSAQIDIDALREYRRTVGRSTREIVTHLKPEVLARKIDPVRLRSVMDEGALLPEAVEILNYWSKRTIAGLLLMPPTRHSFLHLNEALRIKGGLRRRS